MINLCTCSDFQLLSTNEVAEALRISQGSVRKLVRDGRLPAIGGFRVIYISAKAVRDFVKANGMVLPQLMQSDDIDGGRAETRAMDMIADGRLR
jgi:excisionase family DNA binding protein